MKSIHEPMTRRSMLKVSAAGLCAAGALSVGLPTFAADVSDKKKPGLALQLYSIRKACAEDFDKSLEEVAAMGFEGVEFAGYHKYSNDPVALKKRLDDLGLKVAATHIRADSFVGDNLKKTIDFHQTIGCKYLVVPGDGRFSKPDGNKEFSELMNVTAEALKPVGMACGYHNHTHEFEKDPADGKTYWDLFAERTCQDVILQQDCGWSTVAGQDAAALVRKYPGRSKVVHFKPSIVSGDEGKKPIIGEDSCPWGKIYTACVEVGGTKWVTVEQERYLDGKTPMECSELSLAGLKEVIAKLG